MVYVSKAKDYRYEWKKEKYKNVDGSGHASDVL